MGPEPTRSSGHPLALHFPLPTRALGMASVLRGQGGRSWVLMCAGASPHPQVNGVALQDAEHHEAVEALRGAGTAVQMRVWRERMVEPENAVTITPLRPEDDYSPRERRGGGLRLPLLQPEVPGPVRQCHAACLVRSEKGLGFSIAGGKGSTPYRAGDGVRLDGWGCRAGSGAYVPASLTVAAPNFCAGHLHLPHCRGRCCPSSRHTAGWRPCSLGEWDGVACTVLCLSCPPFLT